MDDNIVMQEWDDTRACMECYLGDLEMLDLRLKATEAVDWKELRKKAGEALKKFSQNAMSRILQLIDTIINAISNIVSSLGNLASNREIAVPSDLYNYYIELKNTGKEVTDMADDICSDLLELNTELATASQISPVNAAGVVERKRNRIKQFAEKVDAMQKKDVLAKFGSITDYMAHTNNSAPRSGRLNPSKEQRDINVMANVWKKHRKALEKSAAQVNNALDMMYLMKDEGGNHAAIEQTRQVMSQYYGAGVQSCAIMSRMTGRMSQYINAFIKIDKEWKPNTSIVGGGAKALPAHA